MTDLIDRNELKDRMYHEAFETDTPLQRWDSGCWIRYKMFENILKGIPSVDPDRVQHAEWIEHEDYPGLAYLCSNCGRFTTETSHFCPDCGRKMKKGEK